MQIHYKGADMKEILSLKEKETIKALHAGGKTYYAISKAVKRSPHTVKKYLLSSPEVMQQVQEIKQELADMFEGLARKMISSITEQDIQDINAYQRIVAAGISTDKARLLKGQSTEIVDFNQIQTRRAEIRVQIEALKAQISQSSGQSDGQGNSIEE